MSGASEPPEGTSHAHVGDIAIVLHSHMPLVEGYGTYPFGEEWLFDAVIRSYLPVLAVAENLTMSVTPVMADQLESAGLRERLIEFCREFRLGSARLDAQEMDSPPLRAACGAEADRYADALAELERTGGDLIATFAGAAEEGRVELIASSATHAILPLVATRAMRRVQIETGVASHRRRFGPVGGFWLPECAYEPGLELLLAEAGISRFCVDQSRLWGREDVPAPVVAGAATALPIDWESIEWLWSFEGYPSFRGYADFHRKSWRGTRPWTIDGEPYDPAIAGNRAREQAREFCVSLAARLEAARGPDGRPALITFAIDTELLGHWWWEGPIWLGEVLRLLPEHGISPVKLADAVDRHAAIDRPLGRSSWGEEKDLRTWDSPAVADFAWGSRRLELELLRELDSGRLAGTRLQRAVRELLAVQASDWAFLDYRRDAGDYPFQRVLDHAEQLFEVLDSGEEVFPGVRNLAPDLALGPLFVP